MKGPGAKMDYDEYEGMSEINVTPLVDVFLVLLVIFMITAPVIKTAIEMGLPKAETAVTDPNQGITVKVLSDKTVWIDNERVSLQAFSARFRDIWSEPGADGNPQPVFLAADEKIPYGDVVFIMDELRLAGVEDLGMLTQKEQKE